MVALYVGFGREEILDQIYLSLLSLIRFYTPQAPAKVLIYTDKPDFFAIFKAEPRLKVQVVPITAQQLQDWKGPRNFNFRVKIIVLRAASRLVNEPLIFFDSDTLFYQPIEVLKARVGPGRSVMHLYEYSFGLAQDPLGKKLRRFFKGHPFVVGSESMVVKDDHQMWNSGVIGLDPANFDLIDRMIELSDRLHQAYQKHVMEQLAVSLVLQTATRLASSDDVVFHYWNEKPKFLDLIKNIRAQSSGIDQAVTMVSQMPIPAFSTV